MGKDISYELAKGITDGNTMMVPKTIFNFRFKTKEQKTDILLQVEKEFLAKHPDFQYDNYRYEDGKQGERTIFLIFKRKV